MAAIYTANANANPIVLTADIAATGTAPYAYGWRGLQTLNTAIVKQPGAGSGYYAQRGIWVTKIELFNNNSGGQCFCRGSLRSRTQ